jgi:Ca2+-binding RTX toxin-like protein
MSAYNVQYALDHDKGGPLIELIDQYTHGFKHAVFSEIDYLDKKTLPVPPSDQSGNGHDKVIDFQVIADGSENFDKKNFEGAYVTGQEWGNLNDAKMILFTDEDGVTVDLSGKIDQIVGLTDGDDDLTFGPSSNGGSHEIIVDGGAGNDVIQTAGGHDTAFGGDGDDLISTGGGDDSVQGNDGNDSLYGGNGRDTLKGGAGDDDVFGGAGNDSMRGDDGKDSLSGGDGKDTIDGGSDNDTILGGAGSDKLAGGDGDDSIGGGTGANTVDGGHGFDVASFTGAVNSAFYNTANHEWVVAGNHISNVEFITGNNGFIVTAHDAAEADVARLFHLLTESDPTAQEFKTALDVLGSNFNTQGDLEEIATDINGTNTTVLKSAAKFLVNEWLDNAYGAAAPALDVNAFVNSVYGSNSTVHVSEIAAKLTIKLGTDFASSDATIHIATDPLSH